ncbi:MAG: hypothetical protein QXX12_07035 [Nanopusillaceae archaeon]
MIMILPFRRIIVNEGWRQRIFLLTEEGWQYHYESDSYFICSLNGSSRTESCASCSQYPCEAVVKEPWASRGLIEELMHALGNESVKISHNRLEGWLRIDYVE